ncbi:MAG TPA: DUF1631 domain-containing protein [Xanthomonadaceae bacterium]|nr:DUF1631 domain-containing protein [Xanthomonadaceae bacterium]
MTAAKPASRQTPQKLLESLEAHVCTQLEGPLNKLFDSVDDALFDLADRTAQNNQGDFFQGMREIRRKRQPMHQEFLRLVRQGFADLRMLRLQGVQHADGAPTPRAQLKLMDSAEVELSVAIDAMATRIEGQHTQPLWALNQRFGVLVGAPDRVDNAGNPMGPRRLCEAFSESADALDITVEVRLIVLKLFERHVLHALEALIDQINNALARAGVLPQLRHEIIRKDRPKPVPKEEFEPADESATDTGGSDTRARILQVVDELRSLLAAQRQRSIRLPQGISESALPAVKDEDLLEALTYMQLDLSRQAHAPAEPGPLATPSLRSVKESLLRKVGGMDATGTRLARLGPSEDALDLVGMVFDYAVQDRNLPAPIQAMLGRLQIPYLKVALMDRDFIANPDHPARQLLDRMSEACIGWSEESDRDHRLYDKVQEMVSTVLQDFHDDVGVFDRLSQEFDGFLSQNRKRTELAERRAAETARGREKLDTAQRMAARAVIRRVSGKLMPEQVRSLLTDRWSNYLVFTYLRHGPDSDEWKLAENFVDNVVQALHPPAEESARARLRGLKPALEWTLRKGLAATGVHEQDIEAVWNGLEQIVDHHLGTAGERPRVITLPDQEAANDEIAVRFASGGSGEEVVLDDKSLDETSEVTQEDLDDAAKEWIEVARQLKAGTWFEFLKDDGSRERAKLLWISTIRALYLFVNRNGLKIAEKTAGELAQELHRQRAVILEEAALVNRALDAILSRLRSRKDGGHAPPAAESAGAEGAKGPASVEPSSIGSAA